MCSSSPALSLSDVQHVYTTTQALNQGICNSPTFITNAQLFLGILRLVGDLHPFQRPIVLTVLVCGGGALNQIAVVNLLLLCPEWLGLLFLQGLMLGINPPIDMAARTKVVQYMSPLLFYLWRAVGNGWIVEETLEIYAFLIQY